MYLRWCEIFAVIVKHADYAVRHVDVVPVYAIQQMLRHE